MGSDIITNLEQLESSLRDAVLAIQQPRTDYELRAFVVGQHQSRPRAWAQCVLEEQNKIVAVRRGLLSERQLLRRIAHLEAIAAGEPVDDDAKKRADAADDAEAARLDLIELQLARLGAERELAALENLRLSFGRGYSRDELNAAEPEYWRQRLLRQASQDVNACGRVGVGNQEALRLAGLAAPVGLDYVAEVERRMLEGSRKILVIVPTLIPQSTIEKDGLKCLEGWTIPGVFQQRIHCVVGRPVADAYNEAAHEAVSSEADFLLCVEDDMQPPEDAFDRLWSLYQKSGPKSIVGAWYPQRRRPRTGTAIVMRDGVRSFLDDAGGAVHEVYTVPQGFTLIPTQAFRDIPQPWFVTTGCLTQDSFFSQVARDHGYKLLVDTSLKCAHVDRATGESFS